MNFIELAQIKGAQIRGPLLIDHLTRSRCCGPGYLIFYLHAWPALVGKNAPAPFQVPYVSILGVQSSIHTRTFQGQAYYV